MNRASLISKNLRFDDQIEFISDFPHGLTFGKLLSPFRCPKLPQNIGRLARFFLPCYTVFGFWPRNARVHFEINNLFMPEPIRSIWLTNPTILDRKKAKTAQSKGQTFFEEGGWKVAGLSRS
jgi:hypothetical protein